MARRPTHDDGRLSVATRLAIVAVLALAVGLVFSLALAWLVT